jgi:hypothetical protein
MAANRFDYQDVDSVMHAITSSGPGVDARTRQNLCNLQSVWVAPTVTCQGMVKATLCAPCANEQLDTMKAAAHPDKQHHVPGCQEQLGHAWRDGSYTMKTESTASTLWPCLVETASTVGAERPIEPTALLNNGMMSSHHLLCTRGRHGLVGGALGSLCLVLTRLQGQSHS